MSFFTHWNPANCLDHGPTFKIKCPNCKKSKIWRLWEIHSYFSFFFMPVFPRDPGYYLVCPICHNGLALCPELFDKIKVLADIHGDFTDKRINHFQYQIKLDNLYDSTFNELITFLNRMEPVRGCKA